MKRFNIFSCETHFDAEDPAPYRSGARRVAPELDARRLGASLYELPPGTAVCPYHYESEAAGGMPLGGPAHCGR